MNSNNRILSIDLNVELRLLNLNQMVGRIHVFIILFYPKILLIIEDQNTNLNIQHVRKLKPMCDLSMNRTGLLLGDIKDIDQIRRGFTTAVWKKCLDKRKITLDKENLAFSILYHNNRHSLDLLAETEDIRSQWMEGLEYLVTRYRSHMRTYHEITDQWIWSLFSQADVDQSGQLNRYEVRRLLHFLNIELSERDIDKYFDQANIRVNNSEELTNLDKDEFLIFYKFVSRRPELLKIICQ